MQPQEQVKTENNQQQVENPQNIEQKIETKEESPQIKSEENKQNWAVFRAQREEERKLRQEAERQMQEERSRADAFKNALDSLLNRQSAVSASTESGFTEETEEQRIEKKVAQAFQKEREKLEKESREREERELPQKLVQTFPDFHQICTAENVDYLEYHYPELRAAFSQIPEGYNKWATLYQTVKKFVPNPDSRKDMARAEKNLSKPGSISSIGTTQGPPKDSKPNIISEERKRQNWERMQRDIKGLS